MKSFGGQEIVKKIVVIAAKFNFFFNRVFYFNCRKSESILMIFFEDIAFGPVQKPIEIG